MDENLNGVPDECDDPPADITGDNVVNVSDPLAVIDAWGACPPAPGSCPGDLNGNGAVEAGDLVIVINGWSG